MTVWYYLSTIFKQRRALRIAGLLALCVALTTTLLFSSVSRAEAGVNQALSFQGRLLSSSGAVVPDGHYNIQFKIYQDGDGTQADDTGGTNGALKWTETYANNSSNAGVEVKDGFFSVELGSLNPFGTQVDWNQDTLWLSMNIAGTASSCTAATFDSGSCTADGEMLPMKRITSTPYALNSGMVGGKTADQLAQLGQGVQTDTGTNSSIYINKTGSGNLIQLQNMATDVFTVANTGDLVLGSNANHSISVGASATDVAGMQLTLAAGAGGSGGGNAGGDLILSGGAGGGTNGNGGTISIDAGASTGSGTSGSVTIGSANAGLITIGSNDGALSQNISIGANNTSGSTSNVTIGAGGSANGGSTTVQAKDDLTIKTNGAIRATFSGTENTAYFGNGATATSPNDFKIQGTDSSTTAVTGGALTVQGGSATVGDANGGNITLAGGSGHGTGAAGLVVIGTPTFSTTANDANCYASGALVASSCTIAASSVNGTSAILVGFSTDGQTASLPDPTITTAGRVVYVMAADGSKDFTLSMNGGGTGNEIIMQANTAATMMWNGSDWVVAGNSGSTTLRGNKTADGTVPNVQIGDGADNGTTTLLTLDHAAAAPTVTNDAALLGSMYYDTTLGELQCYEASGWGACSAAPDTFITLSPEYSNAVMHGDDTGTMTEDLCSDTLNINNGSSSQPTVCDSNETYNYYDWTSAETENNQTRSIFVTYQLPSTFKNFVAAGTSLMGRTDSNDSSVTYQIYRNNGSSGLIACGSAIAVSTGTQTSWQKSTASSTADPSNCGFEPGDSIIFEIDLTAKNNANAYVSNLNFAFSNH